MIKCIGTKVACEVLATDSKQGGIWIPETAKENRGYGRVIHAGDKCQLVKKGDTVVLPKFSKTGAADIELNGVRVAVDDESELLAIIETAQPEGQGHE